MPVRMAAAMALRTLSSRGRRNTFSIYQYESLPEAVRGGLISSTALTLFLLPVFYAWMESRRAPAPQSTAEAT